MALPSTDSAIPSENVAGLSSESRLLDMLLKQRIVVNVNLKRNARRDRDVPKVDGMVAIDAVSVVNAQRVCVERLIGHGPLAIAKFGYRFRGG